MYALYVDSGSSNWVTMLVVLAGAGVPVLIIAITGIMVNRRHRSQPPPGPPGQWPPGQWPPGDVRSG